MHRLPCYVACILTLLVSLAPTGCGPRYPIHSSPPPSWMGRWNECRGGNAMIDGGTIVTAQVRGVVTFDGDPTLGVEVFLLFPEARLSFATVTAADGSFRFKRLPSGRYYFRACISGYQVVEHTLIVEPTAPNTPIAVHLQLGV